MATVAALGLLLFGAAVSVLTAGSWPSGLAMLGLAVFSVVWFGGTGLVLVADAIRAGPSIIIGPEDLHDRRQGISIRWTDVRQAEIRASRVGIASLALATRGSNQRSPMSFRVGARRRRADELVIPLQFLSPPPHISGLVMTALIERAGGSVSGKPVWAD